MKTGLFRIASGLLVSAVLVLVASCDLLGNLFDPLTVRTMACGNSHSLIVRSDGSLWGTGANYYGQLGLGTSQDEYYHFARVGSDTDWAQLACGDVHSLGLKTDGTLYAWGCNDEGELGDGTRVSRTVPTRIGNPGEWAAIACGTYHSLGIKKDGSLWAWGDLSTDSLESHSTVVTSPQQVGNDTGWVQARGGWGFTIALKSDGSLYSFGYCFNGELGDGGLVGRAEPARIGAAESWSSIACGLGWAAAVSSDYGMIYMWGGNYDSIIPASWDTRVTEPLSLGIPDIAALPVCPMANHMVCVKADSSLLAWGANTFGQAGIGGSSMADIGVTAVPGDSGYVQVASGSAHTLALRSDGSLWGTGLNTHGQLGKGDSSADGTIELRSFERLTLY